MKIQQNQGAAERQPVFLLPGVITALLGLMLAVHLARELVLNEAGDNAVYVWLAFIPTRILHPEHFDGGLLPLLWTPFTHAFIHAGWEHLIINMAWFAIFGTPLARRYGPFWTLVIFFVGALAGALLFAVTSLDDLAVLVGASGGISGCTGAACRFMFQPVMTARHQETGEVRVLGRKLATFAELARDRRAGGFILIWVVLNAAVPLLPLLLGQQMQISWQAHLGGFIAGLLLPSLIEARMKRGAQ